MSVRWLNEDIEKLKEMVQTGKSVEEMSTYFGRTQHAIEIKVNRLGMQIIRDYRNWSKEEELQFSKDWVNGSISTTVLTNRYHRSFCSLRKKAQRLNLGSRPYNDEYLSVSTISEEMCISKSRVYNWIKLGLKTRKGRSGKTKLVIKEEDLLNFLNKNPDRYNASKISNYLFHNEPDWLLQKRKADYIKYVRIENHKEEYTNEEDLQIISLFKRGIPISDIAEKFKRTEEAIKSRLRVLGYFSGNWNDYEIEILINNSRYLTVDELEKLLPLRKKESIVYKCTSLKLPYHFSKKMCESKN